MIPRRKKAVPPHQALVLPEGPVKRQKVHPSHPHRDQLLRHPVRHGDILHRPRLLLLLLLLCSSRRVLIVADLDLLPVLVADAVVGAGAG